MKDLKVCNKCSSNSIKKLEGYTLRIKGLKIRFINLDHYICTKCGYTEIYVKDKENLEYLEDNI